MFPWINGLGVSSSTQASETISPQVSVWPSEPVLSPAALVSFSRAGFHGHLSLRKELVLFLLFFFQLPSLEHCIAGGKPISPAARARMFYLGFYVGAG